MTLFVYERKIEWALKDKGDVVPETNRNDWAFFPKSNQNNPVLHTNTHTHCPNKPAQLSVTHFMFPIVAWLVGLEYFSCILRSSRESHTLTESLSTMIHFSGNGLLCPAQQLSTVSRPSITPGSQTTVLRSEKFFFFFNNQNIHTTVWAPPLIALRWCFDAVWGNVKQVKWGEFFKSELVCAVWLTSSCYWQFHFNFEHMPVSTMSSTKGGKNIRGLAICSATSNPQCSSRKGLRFVDYFFQESFSLADWCL